jgi:hypothetical protein
VNQTPAEAIVQFLSFSSHRWDDFRPIEQFSPRQWERVLPWLDDAGLALYFLQKLKDTHTSDAIPASALNRLQQNFRSNQLRVDHMSHRFQSINNCFNAAGVHYTVIKGFSLVPQFSASAALRHQSDFDYLVDEPSLPAATQVLVQAGYVPKDSHSSSEAVFVTPFGKPSRSAEQYSPRSPHAVELHTDLWEADLNRLPQIPKLPFLERAVAYHWNGLTFPALDDEDAFLLQVLHACGHLFTFWIRMSCLFEIGYFLHRRAYDREFWNRTEQRVADSRILREFVVIITELASRLFRSPVPPPIDGWAANIRPASRVWLQHYARRCVFSELPAYQFSLFPTAKFVLFLHQQFREQAPVGKSVLRKRLLPSTRLWRIVLSIRRGPSSALNADWWKHQLLVRRSLFHLLAGLRYVWEVPRWRWLNRTKVPIA